MPLSAGEIRGSVRTSVAVLVTLLLVLTQVCCLLLASACTRNARPLRGEGTHAVPPAPRPALELAQPVLRFVPSSAEFVLVAPDLQLLLHTATAFEPLLGDVPMVSDWLTGLRSNLGAIAERETWTRFGLDPSQALALFSEGTSSTLLLPVQPDAAGWQELASALFAAQSELLRDDRGGVLALRWTLEEPPAKEPWVAAMRAAASGENFAASAEAEHAAAFAKASLEALPDAAALGSESRIWGHLKAQQALAHAPVPCVGLAAGVQGMSIGATSHEGQADLQVELSLSNGAADSLLSVLGPAAAADIDSLRASEGLSLSARFDSERSAEALSRLGCAELAAMIDDKVQELGFAPSALHLVGSRFDPSELSGRLALDLGLHDKRYFYSMLDQIPGRSLFESKLTVQGQRVVKVSVPLMSTLYYQLSDRRLLFSTHKGMIGQLLGAPGSAQEVAFVQVVPERLPQLTQLLALGMPQRDARSLAEFLRHFALLRARLELKDNRLLLAARLRLADS